MKFIDESFCFPLLGIASQQKEIQNILESRKILQQKILHKINQH